MRFKLNQIIFVVFFVSLGVCANIALYMELQDDGSKLIREEVVESKVKVGEIWCYLRHKNNPFEDVILYRHEVIAVKNGYVKYKDVLSGKIYSDSIRSFLVGSYLETVAEAYTLAPTAGELTQAPVTTYPQILGYRVNQND